MAVAPRHSIVLDRVVGLYWIVFFIGLMCTSVYWIIFLNVLNCTYYWIGLYFFFVPSSTLSFYWIGTCCGTVLNCISCWIGLYFLLNWIVFLMELNCISYLCPVAVAPRHSIGLGRVVGFYWIAFLIGMYISLYWFIFLNVLNCSSYWIGLYFLLVLSSTQFLYWIACCGTVLNCISYRCHNFFGLLFDCLNLNQHNLFWVIPEVQF